MDEMRLTKVKCFSRSSDMTGEVNKLVTRAVARVRGEGLRGARGGSRVDRARREGLAAARRAERERRWKRRVGRSVGRSARKAKREEMDWTLLKTEPRAARAKGECGFVGVGGREDGNGGGSRKGRMTELSREVQQL